MNYDWLEELRHSKNEIMQIFVKKQLTNIGYCMSDIDMTERKITWDGSYLGEFTPEIIISKIVTKELTYARIQLNNNGEDLICRIKKVTKMSNMIIPHLVDELKPVFGLIKVGSHYLKIGRSYYSIFKVQLNQQNEIIVEQKLSDVTPDQIMSTQNQDISVNVNVNIDGWPQLFRQQIQEILCFREVIGLTTYERYIRVRFPLKGCPYPISYHETTIPFYTQHSSLSKKMIEKWFKTCSVGHVLARMMRIDFHDRDSKSIELTSIIAQYRSNIETVINRIDKESIWRSSYILERMLRRLLEILPDSAVYQHPPLLIIRQEGEFMSDGSQTNSPVSLDSPTDL